MWDYELTGVTNERSHQGSDDEFVWQLEVVLECQRSYAECKNFSRGGVLIAARPKSNSAQGQVSLEIINKTSLFKKKKKKKPTDQ